MKFGRGIFFFFLTLKSHYSHFFHHPVKDLWLIPLLPSGDKISPTLETW